MKKDVIWVSKWIDATACMVLMVSLLGLLWLTDYVEHGEALLSIAPYGILLTVILYVVYLLFRRKVRIDETSITAKRFGRTICTVDLQKPVYYQTYLEHLYIDGYFRSPENNYWIYVSNEDFSGWETKKTKWLTPRPDWKTVVPVLYFARIQDRIPKEHWIELQSSRPVTRESFLKGRKTEGIILGVLALILVVFEVVCAVYEVNALRTTTVYEPESTTNHAVFQYSPSELKLTNGDTLVYDEYDTLYYAPEAGYLKAWSEEDHFAKSKYTIEQVKQVFEESYPGASELSNVSISFSETEDEYVAYLLATRLDNSRIGAKFFNTGFVTDFYYDEGMVLYSDYEDGMQEDGWQKVSASERDALGLHMWKD